MQLRWVMIYGSFVGSSFLNVIESPAPAANRIGSQIEEEKEKEK